MKFDKIIVDADLCIKLGCVNKIAVLETLFPNIAQKVYIHEAVFDEIQYPILIKEQLKHLRKNGQLEILHQNQLGFEKRSVYENTYEILSKVMSDPKNPRKNFGEICSLSMAKAESIHVFATDEKDLQPIIDANLNTGLDNIYCVRIIDIITRIRSGEIEGLNRKFAKLIWALSGKNKDDFDDKIWPL